VIVSAGQLVNCGTGSVGLLLFMSGHQSRALRIQAFLSPLVVALTFTMIGVWGLIGAAVVVAFTNAITNLLYLREVRKRLGIFPSLRGYSTLLVPSLATLSITLFLRFATSGMRLQFAAILASLLLAYGAFFFATATGETTPDDRLIFREASAFIRQSSIGRRLTRPFFRISNPCPR